MMNAQSGSKRKWLGSGLRALGLTGLLSFAALCPLSNAQAQTFEMKISHAANTKHPIHATLERFKELAEQRSNGRLAVKIFHSGQLAGQREGVEGVQMGTIEAVGIPAGVAAAFAPVFSLLDVPFQFDSLEHGRRMMDQHAHHLLFDGLESVGFVGLAVWEQGYRNLGNTKRAVKTVADVKDMKIRTLEAPLHVAAWRAIGANPTPMGWADVLPALQQGVVDGVEIPSYLFTQTGLHEVVKHVTRTQHLYDCVIVLGSKRWFDKLPADLQKVVRDTMRELTGMERDLNQKDVDEAEAQMPGLKVTLTDLTPEARAEFAAKSQAPVLQSIRTRLPGDRVDRWMKAVADTKAK
jgi:tripartite ATP-independent transporter DctP family solute receptor